jgi:hypothetical protein
MMGAKELTFQYDVAEGPEKLRELLDTYLTKTQNDLNFASIGHYILYTLGEQRSLIRVDTSEIPFRFRYCDLLGRSATRAVRDTIAKFLWERCGEREKYKKETEMNHLTDAQASALYAGHKELV